MSTRCVTVIGLCGLYGMGSFACADGLRLGVEGASCTRTGDCQDGLECISEICQSEPGFGSGSESGMGDDGPSSNSAQSGVSEADGGGSSSVAETAQTEEDSSAASSELGSDSETGDVPLHIIDDMEDGDGKLIQAGGRDGSWYVFADSEGDGELFPSADAFEMSPGGADDDSAWHALCHGEGFTSYVGMGFYFMDGGTPHDASQYQGVRFQFRNTKPMVLGIHSAPVVPESQAGTCDQQTGDCFDAHQIVLEANDDWRAVKVAFSELKQQGWGTPAEFDATTLMMFTLSYHDSDAFEFAIDDIEFW